MNGVLYAVRMAMVQSAHPHRSPSVGFIGLGNMGMPMACNYLAAASGPLFVTARSRERAQPAIAGGARWAETPRDIADECSSVVIMVPDLPQVNELLFAPGGIAESTGSSTIIVCSSVSPAGIRESAARIAESSAGRMTLVDAPVSGGTEGAEAGTLSIMVGGDSASVERVLPLLRTFGTPVHLGPLGAGQTAKACNQLIVAATIAAISEASVIAERSGLNIEALLSLLEQGYAGSRVLQTKKRAIIDRDYTPTGVARYMVKDLGFAAAEASESHTSTPVLDVLRKSFDGLVEAGLGDDDLAVMHRYIQLLPRDS